jgi:hypothetical protein
MGRQSLRRQRDAGFKLLIRSRLYASAQLYAFNLLELDGEDLRG